MELFKIIVNKMVLCSQVNLYSIHQEKKCFVCDPRGLPTSFRSVFNELNPSRNKKKWLFSVQTIQVDILSKRTKFNFRNVFIVKDQPLFLSNQ